jgi:hypothetical protein
MAIHLGRRRDPFWDDGVGARGRNRRVWAESLFAFGIAVTACGLTLAMWIHSFGPMVRGLTGI